jgi:hypothetical protein
MKNWLFSLVMLGGLFSPRAFSQVGIDSLQGLRPNGAGTVFRADLMQGADYSVKFNACVTAAITAKGTCDARALIQDVPATQEFTIGDTAGDPVTVLLPVSATWKSAVTGSTACAARIYSGATVIAQTVGAGQTKMNFDTNASTQTLEATVCTSKGSQTFGYVNAQGFGALNTGRATEQASWEVSFLYDQSRWSVYGGAPSNGGRACWIHDTNSPVDYRGSQCYGSQGFLATSSTTGGDYTKGGYGLVIGPNAQEVTLDEVTLNAPAVGFNNLRVIGNGTWGVRVQNSHLEGNCLVDSATPMIYTDGATTEWGFSIRDSAILNECNPSGAANTTKYPIENHTFYQFIASNISTSDTLFINDTTTTPATIVASLGYGTPNAEYRSGFGTSYTPLLQANQFIPGISFPTIVKGAAAGTSPTISVSGTNLSHVITLTLGTTPAAGILGTLTFSPVLSVAPANCSLTSRNTATPPTLTSVSVGTISTSTYTLNATTALSAGTYAWGVTCQ